MTTLSDHLAVSKPDRDLDWLKDALQVAIELEHSTLPLYTCAMLSLRVQNYTAYNLIRSVAMEEMVHMAIACNILAAIGGRPRIKDLTPGFPGQGLPGGAEPDLPVRLAPLSKRQLQNFMRLEIPGFLLPEEYQQETYPTISTLYQGVLGAVERNAAPVRDAMKKGGTSNQVGDDIGFTTLTYSAQQDPVRQIRDGIDEIITQGEGSPAATLHADPGSEEEEAHYAKFAEIYYGRRYQQPASGVALTRETEPQFFQGNRIPFPEVVNTLAVPKDGYAKVLKEDPDRAGVEAHLSGFDQAYTSIMTGLDAMWNGPASQTWPTFGAAVRAMGDLRVLAAFNVMQHQVPPGVVAKLTVLYPDEHADLSAYTDLSAPVFYGPRFVNLNAPTPPSA